MLNRLMFLLCLTVGTIPAWTSSVYADTPACGLQECHGLEVSCGPNPPQACTAMYRMGDFCRQFVSCQEAAGQCRLEETREFRGCKSCVQDCERIKDPMSAFDCESRCRKEYERDAAQK